MVENLLNNVLYVFFFLNDIAKMIFWTAKYTNTNAQIYKYKFRKTQMHKYSI